MPEKALRFQHKLWQIVNSCQSGAAFWSESGDSIIFRFSQFKKEYLDRNANFCKSNKIASFVRQLNLYGFRKLVKAGSFSKKRLQDLHEFQNPDFQRGRRDLLENVVRSSTTPAVWKRSTHLSESCFKRRPKRRRGKGRRKIKCENIELDDADHCYGKLKTNPFPEDRKPAQVKNGFSVVTFRPGDSADFEGSRLESKTPVVANGEQPKLEVHSPKQHANETYELLKSVKRANKFLFENTPSLMVKKEYAEEDFANLDDDFSLVTENDEDDELYKALLSNDDDQNYLNEPILFSENDFFHTDWKNPVVKFCSCNDCEVSEEYLELLSSYERMNDTTRPFSCVCDAGIPPTWMLPAFPV